MSAKQFTLIVLISMALTAAIWVLFIKTPAEDGRPQTSEAPIGHQPSAAPAAPAAPATGEPSAPIQLDPAEQPSVGEAHLPVTPPLEPNEFLLENPRLRLIPPVNAAQWMAAIHPPADRRYQPRLYRRLWQDGKMVLEDSFSPDVFLKDTAGMATLWGIDIHRPERLDEREKPLLRMILVRKSQDKVNELRYDLSPAPAADVELTYHLMKTPPQAVSAPARVPVLAIMQRAAGTKELTDPDIALAPDDIKNLAAATPWLMVISIEFIDSQAPPVPPAEKPAAPPLEPIPDSAADRAARPATDTPPTLSPRPAPAAPDLTLSDALPRDAFYVSPTGRSDGVGSRRRPLSLEQALSINSPVKPGQSLLLLPGNYEGSFTSHLFGAPGKPITIRPAGDGPVTIVSTKSHYSPLHLRGDWLILQDIELTVRGPRSLPSRVPLDSVALMMHLAGSPAYETMRGAGLVVAGGNVILQGLRIHDCGDGMWLLNAAAPVEVNGCIIYNNGRLAAGGLRGAGIRMSNRGSRKSITNNIIFNNLGPGIQAHSDLLDVSRIDISGNVIFNSGLFGVLAQPNVMLGADSCQAGQISVLDNVLWQRNGVAAAFGGTSAEGDITVSGNLFNGLVRFRQWRKADVQQNTFLARGTMVALHLPAGLRIGGYTWNRNSYIWQQSDFEPFAHYADNSGGGSAWHQWQQTTGLDAAGSFVTTGLTSPYVQVRGMGRDGGGRWSYVAILASAECGESAEVDLSSVLAAGERYRIYHVEDVARAVPVLESEWSGDPVSLPLRAVEGPASPAGLPMPFPPSGPEFQVFVIELLPNVDRN